MIDENKTLTFAQQAVDVARKILPLDREIPVSIISNPDISEDALYDTSENIILLNTAILVPFRPDELGLSSSEGYENMLYYLKIAYLMFHEVRHAYQKRTLEGYTINQTVGGRLVPQPESDKKCALWLEAMKADSADNSEIEDDAEAFAVYMIHRWPIKMEWSGTNKRLGVMKRKYDKIEIETFPGFKEQ